MAAPVTYYSPENFFGRGLAVTDFNATLQADLESAQCFIPLDITALRGVGAAGSLAIVSSGPILERVNGGTDKTLRVTWAASVSTEAQFPPTPWPPDLDADNNVIFHSLVQRSGSTDDCDIDVLAYEGIGDTECGGKTAALTSTSLTEVTVTLSASDIAGHPGFLNLSLLPDAHGTDAIYLYSGWLEYSRMLRTS